MRKNAIAFRSVDPRDEDFSDLQPLKDLIGNAQIVQLGEQSHGDGKCFETKIRLIKFLHQEMGFDILAFESGFYDCHRAWKAYRDGEVGIDAAELGVFESGPAANKLAHYGVISKSKRKPKDHYNLLGLIANIRRPPQENF